jgi:protein-disulfide isomerase
MRDSWKDIVLTIGNVVMTICLVALTATYVRDRWGRSSRSPSSGPRPISDWQTYQQAGNRIGPVSSSVTIVEFSDFQCPFCRRAADGIKAVREKYPDVALVYRHFPLEFHPHAKAAAIAAECAADVGRFEAYHDLLWANADSLAVRDLTELARQAGVRDLPGFKQCLADPRTAARVERDRKEGLRLGVTGTPTFLINNLAIDGYPGSDELHNLVSTALKTPPGK